MPVKLPGFCLEIWSGEWSSALQISESPHFPHAFGSLWLPGPAQSS